MRSLSPRRLGGLALTISLVLPAHAAADRLHASFVDTYDELCGAKNDDEGCAEISAFDTETSRVFTTNGTGNALRVLQLSDDGSLHDRAQLSLAPFGAAPNSVTTSAGQVAVAMEADEAQANGQVVLFDAQSLEVTAVIGTGALPDMLVFTPDGRYLLVANEGEPNDDYSIDPEGSVSVIDMHTLLVRTADFAAFATLADPDVRIFGPGATVAQDLEPEYIAVSGDSRTAWVSLQENNALAILDIESATVGAIVGLGVKDHSQPGNGFDASDRDGSSGCPAPLEEPEQCIVIQPQPTVGMYQPDAIATYHVDGVTYIVSANEGDARDYDGFSEEFRVGDDEIVLDADAYPQAEALKEDAALGRLRTTSATGDTDGDGDIDVIHSFGARSFSIWNHAGEQVYDSGDEFERRLADGQLAGMELWTDNRSDDKGPEPEAVTIGHLGGMSVAFIGLERSSGVFAYDISDPTAANFLGYIDTKRAGDISPEGLVFVPVSPNSALLIVTNELSNTTSTYRVAVSGLSTEPTVSGNLISWNEPGYWQVQTADDYRTLCEGRDIASCEVEEGTYNVINHSTGDRFEHIAVGAG